MMEGAAWARDGEATSKRGVKRQLDESNDDDLRFTKRFNLLSIGTCYYIFVVAYMY